MRIIFLFVLLPFLGSAVNADNFQISVMKNFDCNFGGAAETVKVDIHPINFESDKKKPPQWGSISSVKVMIGSQSIDATPINKDQQRLAVVTSAPPSSISAQRMTLYEIDTSIGRVRRSYFDIFSGKPS